MRAAELLGATLVERVGSATRGYVTEYQHPRHGACVMRHDDKGASEIWLAVNVPSHVRELQDALRAQSADAFARRLRNRGDARDRV